MNKNRHGNFSKNSKVLRDGFKKILHHIPSFLCPIHQEGWMIIAGFGFFSLIAAHFSFVLGFVGLMLTLWSLYFFRDPERVTPVIEGSVISPADGILINISEVNLPSDIPLEPGKYTRLSIFMNVFNVHVNRYPVSGIVTHMSYHKGLFLNAQDPKASTQNEHQNYVVTMKDSTAVAFSQIAGLIARRIKTIGKVNESVTAGQRCGIIKFGSRVDVYLPLRFKVLVISGQKMIAGETILAQLS